MSLFLISKNIASDFKGQNYHIMCSMDDARGVCFKNNIPVVHVTLPPIVCLLAKKLPSILCFHAALLSIHCNFYAHKFAVS